MRNDVPNAAPALRCTLGFERGNLQVEYWDEQQQMDRRLWFTLEKWATLWCLDSTPRQTVPLLGSGPF